MKARSSFATIVAIISFCVLGSASAYAAGGNEAPSTFSYPLTMTVQPALKGGPNIQYVVTVTNSASSTLSFGPTVQLDPLVTVTGSTRHLIYVPNTGNQVKEWFVGKLKPGQSRQWVLSVAPNIDVSAIGWYAPTFVMHDYYYQLDTVVQTGGSMK